ncbi:MAG TPA: helical backbone metal receptor [Burkholderiales bacterium]|nr:helical backbone metal receptor [Burkholderiales bacterium]
MAAATPIAARELRDALGTCHEVAPPGAKIVSLVPSITELLFELDLSSSVVGRTGFCTEPRDRVKRVPRVGGTKTIDLTRLRRLAPTHVIVNIDENPRAATEEIARFVPHVIVTHPLAPLDNVALYRLLGGIFGREAQAERLVHAFEQAYEQARESVRSLPPQGVLYMIWKSPWMTVSADTYISRTLATVGWQTVAPASNARYPAFDLTPEFLAGIDLVLLSSEPYSFRERHCDQVRALVPTGSRTRVALIDGSMTSWYGSRAIEGMRYLGRLRRELS